MGGRGTWPPKVMPRELACWGMMSCVICASVMPGVTRTFSRTPASAACTPQTRLPSPSPAQHNTCKHGQTDPVFTLSEDRTSGDDACTQEHQECLTKRPCDVKEPSWDVWSSTQ